MKTLAKVALVLGAALAALALAAAAYYFAATAGVRIDEAKFYEADSRVAVFDGEDAPVTEVSLRGAHKQVRAAALPSHVKDAFIAAEDKRFYSHRGLDVRGMARAFCKNLRARAFVQGASTISQQLVKNTQLSGEKTLKRKLREIKLTKQLEKKFSKEQILEMYLNTIYFGHTCYGIAAAAEFYFGKEAPALRPAEGAMLAAVIRSPNNYSPFTAPERCLATRNAVLRRMRTLGYLDGPACAAAEAEPLPEPRESAAADAAYLSAVCRELENIPLLAPYRLRGGCKVYTYLDAGLQNYAEALPAAENCGRSLLVVDNRTGGILAAASTAGEPHRQPASLIKPVAVYAPAVEEGLLSPATPILDEKTTFHGYAPENYKGVYRGYVPARQALAESLNVPAVKVLASLGLDTCERYMQRAGLPLAEEDKHLALALGGTGTGYTLRQLTEAYTAFPRGGTRIGTAFIRRIESADGETLYERSPETHAYCSEDTAQLLNGMLADAAKTGTAKRLANLPFTVAAKTGTNGTAEGNTDAYTVAYTTEHTVGVWMGNADNSPAAVTGGGLPCRTAEGLLRRLYENAAPPPFADDAVVRCRLDRASYEKDHTLALAAEHQPARYVFTDCFRAQFCPTAISPVFSEPDPRASIACQNNGVNIELCLTEYYGYTIERENDGKKLVLLDGKCRSPFRDETAEAGVRYTYTVTAWYADGRGGRVRGKPQTLPAVCLGTAQKKPPVTDKPWWEA